MHRREPGTPRPVTAEAAAAELAGAGTGRHAFVGDPETRAGGAAAGGRSAGSRLVPGGLGMHEPRPVPVTVWRRVDADLRTAFDVGVPIQLAAVFRGSGPLPAVTRTEGPDGDWGTVGQERTVHLADGGQLEERIVEVHHPGLFRYEVVPTHGMLRLLVRRIDGQFVFAPSEAGGTVIRWTYVFRPRRGAHSIVRAIAPAWRRYADQVMERIAAQIAAVGATATDVEPPTN